MSRYGFTDSNGYHVCVITAGTAVEAHRRAVVRTGVTDLRCRRETPGRLN